MWKVLLHKRRKVPTLVTIVQEYLKRHGAELGDIGDVPQKLMQPVFEYIKPQDLHRIQKMTGERLFVEDIWKRHCMQININERSHGAKTWRLTWLRGSKEQREKLKKFGAKLNRMNKRTEEKKAARSVKVLSGGVKKTQDYTY
mmetsp:Transcript_5379/g.5863  ORF Transcript_5379/g.5863 Transcript_5379/m.5863 type:complete len:143 (+) Transcript_5379:49-477(+)